MRKAVCSGSFDPITLGHLDIIERSAGLFDEVTVLILINPDKKLVFTPEERQHYIESSIAHLPNVKVDVYGGLLVDYARENNVIATVRGLRAVSDFEYEFQMALINKELYPEMESVFLNTSREYMYLSSSMVRNVALFGGDISSFVPRHIVAEVSAKLSERKG